MKTKAVLIAGAGSGTGKTTVTLGLMAALSKKGLTVQGFKTGPDYIDPSLHKIISNRPSVNLDTWMMPRDFLKRSFAYRAKKADISVIEGVMGLFDGRHADAADGSTAELAKQLNVPVVLIINAASMARTAAAIVQGMVNFDPDVTLMGVVFNQVASPYHLEILKKAVAAYCTVPVLGGIFKNPDLSLPSRHLGLFMGEDGILTPEKIHTLETEVSKGLDVDGLLERAEIDIPDRPLFGPLKSETCKVAAIAKDNAFCFYYEDNIEILKHLGYDIVFFSPLKDERLPENADVYYFGGGYPELYAKALSENKNMRQSVLNHCENGAFIYGECGGLMYLGEALTTVDGTTYPMCGCFPFETAMQERLQSLGYTDVWLEEDMGFFKRTPTALKGHCFHYSAMTVNKGVTLKNIYKGHPEVKAKGFRKKNTLASYVHLHFSSFFSSSPSPLMWED